MPFSPAPPNTSDAESAHLYESSPRTGVKRQARGTVISSVGAVLTSSGTVLRTSSFNVFAQPGPSTTSSLFRSIHVLRPCSERENIRVLSRAKDAAHQLTSEEASQHPGILWIGLTPNQDPLAIRNRLLSNFNNDKLRGIS